MNKDEYINSCAMYLGRLSHEIRALNAAGRFDINSVTEDFLVPVLKELFDCPELQNQNEIQQNFPSVDLGCRKSKTSFQVTTDASSDKITKTLTKFREHRLEQYFERVYVLTITEKQTSYAAKALGAAISALPIKFDPQADILDITDIISRLRGLETPKLGRIETYLASEFTKRDQNQQFRAQLDKFLEFSQSKIDFEKRSKKYIPNIFIETHKTKDEVRLFSNPLFFYRKLQDKLKDVNYSDLNFLLKLGKEPEICLEIDSSLLDAAPSTFTELWSWLTDIDSAIQNEVGKLGPLSWKYKEYGGQYKVTSGDAASWSIVRFRVESITTGLTWLLEEARALIALMQNKIFLITSMAGQGKTNFVCDLVDRQFRAFELPCIFIPARELNSYQSRQRLLGFVSNNRYAPSFSTIHQYLGFFDQVAGDVGKPFLIVIDGINEVNALEEFNDELKDFCNAVCQYDLIKVVVTCRSEFFDEKYSSLLNEPFSDQIHRVKDLRAKMTDASKRRLLRSYLDHFQVTGRLSGVAKEFLQNDLLLLRIFSESHEGQHVGFLSDIYKGDLFEEFLRRKIALFPDRLKAKAFPTLIKIVKSMLEAEDFSTISVRDFADDEKDVIHRLVGEDVILRQEITPTGLASLGELIISFTYDELRDFVIAYSFIQSDGSTESINNALTRLSGRPVFEGVYRYVYLLARKLGATAAIAACESAKDFVNHYALNVHLLPPSVQNSQDVDRLNAILADTAFPDRVRRAAAFLIRRGNFAELLNISILINHLNFLDDSEHHEFVTILFTERNDFSRNWQGRLNQFVEQVCAADGEEISKDRSAEWWAFFLHVSSSAGWFERENAAGLFSKHRNHATLIEALRRVQQSNANPVRALITEIHSSTGGE
ncbi:SMEK domain-containing protein [Agrobacterium tumefaciens]|uniref:SMEK domain-containing protein n=1 Tax=Agrobacterium tumefaciens TaxID=358 RepID=UPI0021D2BC87|nr:SMEK domain-containing protein [Agrobacterium tumefaciens]UXS48282.1 SMEK domain-containing protein [Agrobacterium tumefaciens]